MCSLNRRQFRGTFETWQKQHFSKFYKISKVLRGKDILKTRKNVAAHPNLFRTISTKILFCATTGSMWTGVNDAPEAHKGVLRWPELKLGQPLHFPGMRDAKFGHLIGHFQICVFVAEMRCISHLCFYLLRLWSWLFWPSFRSNLLAFYCVGLGTIWRPRITYDSTTD